MTFALYTFKLPKTLCNHGNVNYLMKLRFLEKLSINVIFSDLTVQSTKWWQ